MSTMHASDGAIPDHVPAERVWQHNIDEFNRELDDPYLAASRLHDGPDIFWARNVVMGQPGWILTRHALIQEVFIDAARFSSERNNLAFLGVSWKLNPLEYDPPEHHTYRRILNPYFGPSAVSKLDVPVREVCDSLIAEFADRGACEFVTDFAEKFPSYVFLDLMGMPREMLPQFLGWERDLLRSTDPVTRVSAMKAVLHYLEGFVAEQRKQPSSELMRGIYAARLADGRPLDEGEILGMCYLFYIGGLDTVYSSLGWILRHLASDAPLQQRLRDNPQDIPHAIEEFLRAYPVATPHRTVKEDLVFHGVFMRKGDNVLLPTYLSGRDPLAFENPHVVDIDRRARHIAFGTGPHACLGNHLARRELKTVIEAFLSRFRNIRIPAGERYAYHTGSVFGVDRLPLEWDRASGG